MLNKLFDKIFRPRFYGLKINKKDAETLFLKIKQVEKKG